jgi:hypothetical protein
MRGLRGGEARKEARGGTMLVLSAHARAPMAASVTRSPDNVRQALQRSQVGRDADVHLLR